MRIPASIRWHVRNLVIAWLLACAGIAVFERSITYQSEPSSPSPEASGLAGIKQSVLAAPDGAKLSIWEAAARQGQPTLLYFHGNGEALAYRAARIRYFQAEGWGVFILAWRGYSGSDGRPTEASNRHDALLAYDTLLARGLRPADIVLYGESMGASIAVQTSLQRQSRAVILEAPFTSMVATWRQFVPFLPVGLLLRDRYDTLSVIGQVEAPLLIMHGTRDWLVWPRQGRALFDAVRGPKRLIAIEGARHSNIYDFGAIDVMRRFLEEQHERQPR